MSNRIEKASIEISDYAQSISKGGTSGMSIPQAAENLGYVRNSKLGIVGGVAKTNSQGKLSGSLINADVTIGTQYSIGPSNTARGGEKTTFYITNYNSFTTYVVTTAKGVVEIVEDKIYYTPTNVSGQGGFTVNGEFFAVAITTMKPNKPTLTYPTNGGTGLQTTFTATCNAFSISEGTDTHHSSRWQVSTTPGFTTIVYESADDVNSKTLRSCGPLVVDTQYYIRVAHKGVASGYSDWSDVVVFNTSIPKPNTPSITSPVNGATNTGTKITATTNAFSVPSGSDTHASTHWQVSASSSFTTMVSESVDDATNKVSWTSGTLGPSTLYYVRARHKGSATSYSEWSTAVSFTTAAAVPAAPIITSPTDGAVNIGKTATVTAGAFSISNGTDTHAASHWQLSTSATFSTILYESLDDATNKTTWTSGTLAATTQYYIRVRYKGATYGYSTWSNAISVTTNSQIPDTPSIATPYNGSTGESKNPVIGSSSFAVTNGTDTHAASHWQLSSNSSFSSILFESIDDTVNKTSWSPGTLNITTTYYVRVKHKGSSFGYSQWSSVSSFTTLTPTPLAPTITSPSSGQTNVGTTVTVTTSAFSMNTGTDTHAATHWQISTSSGFSTIAYESLDNTVNKTSWTSGVLNAATTYYIRVRYKGTTYGYGPWSSTVSFSTASSFIPTTLQSKLSASDGTATTSFGLKVTVSADGNSLVVGNTKEFVYFFTRSGSTWTQQSKFTSNDFVTGDGFGQTLSLSTDANTLLVGSPNADPNGVAQAGAAYIFTRSGSTWTQQAKLVASDGATWELFGFSASLSGDGNTAVVGSIDATHSGITKAGAAYVFTRSGSTWTQQVKLIAANTYQLGYNVATNSDASVILASSPSKMAVYVFTKSGSTWTYSSTITASDGVLDDMFGGALAISADGNTALVGAEGVDANGYTNTGAAYVFKRSGSTWTQQAKLIASDAADRVWFGDSVALTSDGSVALIGSYLAQGASLYLSSGAAYVFTRSGTTWSERSKFTSSDGAYRDYFGMAVTISSNGSTIAIGAAYNDANGIDASGAVYVFA